MTEREEAVFKQYTLVSQLIAEISINVLPRNEGLMLLDAGRQIYSGEVECGKTLKGCLRTFDNTEEMI